MLGGNSSISAIAFFVVVVSTGNSIDSAVRQDNIQNPVRIDAVFISGNILSIRFFMLYSLLFDIFKFLIFMFLYVAVFLILYLPKAHQKPGNTVPWLQQGLVV